MIVVHGFSCTIFKMTKNGITLVGNNEDYIYPKTRVWFTSRETNLKGCIFFGYENYWPLGGMNEDGLFFDWALTPVKKYKSSDNNITINNSVCELMLQKCSTVDEALNFINNYNIQEIKNSHMLIADRFGTSAIVEWDGNEICTIKKQGEYQILANFNLCGTPDSWKTSGRYYDVEEKLKKCDSLTVEYIRDCLKLVHQSGNYPTLYSNVYDMQNGLVYVYYQHNYNYVHVFDLKKELLNGSNRYNLSGFFPQVISEEFISLDFKKKYNKKELSSLGVQLNEIKEYDKALCVYEYYLKLYSDDRDCLTSLIELSSILKDDKRLKKYSKMKDKMK